MFKISTISFVPSTVTTPPPSRIPAPLSCAKIHSHCRHPEDQTRSLQRRLITRPEKSPRPVIQSPSLTELRPSDDEKVLPGTPHLRSLTLSTLSAPGIRTLMHAKRGDRPMIDLTKLIRLDVPYAHVQELDVAAEILQQAPCIESVSPRVIYVFSADAIGLLGEVVTAHTLKTMKAFSTAIHIAWGPHRQSLLTLCDTLDKLSGINVLERIELQVDVEGDAADQAHCPWAQLAACLAARDRYPALRHVSLRIALMDSSEAETVKKGIEAGQKLHSID
ncbi:hypothetical protein BDZ97DRAFT_1918328 [Flammula alnicola]|nr:hypothetical protein BDZ97DRAFT_1918328 [Flammula alnicola]